MLSRCLGSAFFIIKDTKCTYSTCSLSGKMGRCKRKRYSKLICDDIFKYRDSVSEECYGFSHLIQHGKKLLNSHCHLILYRHEPVILVTIDSRINLLSSGIHDRTDQSAHIIEIVSKCLHCRNPNQRFVKGKSKSLGCGRANTESGKRARSLGYRNSVNRLQIQLCHLHDLIQHGKKSLGMCFLIINRIFRYQCIVLHNGYGCHDSGTVQCQNSHSVFSPLSSMVIFLYSKPFSRSFSMVTSILFSGRISSMSSAHSIRQIPCPKK